MTNPPKFVQVESVCDKWVKGETDSGSFTWKREDFDRLAKNSMKSKGCKFIPAQNKKDKILELELDKD